MTALTPQLDIALRSANPTIFGALSFALPGYTLNLLDGAGQVSFGGKTFLGEDATFGVLSDVEELTDGAGDSAPSFTITLIPSDTAAAATLAAPTMQGASVQLFIGALNPATGLAIPDPHLVFSGEIDVPTLHADEAGRRVEYEVTSVLERLFEDDESARLSPGHHRSIFPAEAGLDFVTGVDQPVYWGIATPANVVTGR